MKRIYTLLWSVLIIALGSCSMERENVVEQSAEVSSLQALALTQRLEFYKALRPGATLISQTDLRSMSVDEVSAEDYEAYMRDMQAMVHFRADENVRILLQEKGFADKTVEVLTSLDEYLRAGKELSVEEIAGYDIPFSEKEALVKAIVAVDVAKDEALGELSEARLSARDRRILAAMDLCWDEYLEDLAFYGGLGAVGGGLTGGPLGFAVGGVSGILTARYELRRCLQHARRA